MCVCVCVRARAHIGCVCVCVCVCACACACLCERENSPQESRRGPHSSASPRLDRHLHLHILWMFRQFRTVMPLPVRHILLLLFPLSLLIFHFLSYMIKSDTELETCKHCESFKVFRVLKVDHVADQRSQIRQLVAELLQHLTAPGEQARERASKDRVSATFSNL